MGNDVPHALHAAEGQAREKHLRLNGESAGCLADDLETSQNGVLLLRIGHEFSAADTRKIPADDPGGIENIPQKTILLKAEMETTDDSYVIKRASKEGCPHSLKIPRFPLPSHASHRLKNPGPIPWRNPPPIQPAASNPLSQKLIVCSVSSFAPTSSQRNPVRMSGRGSNPRLRQNPSSGR